MALNLLVRKKKLLLLLLFTTDCLLLGIAKRENKQNSFFAAVIKNGTFEIHLRNVCACIHSMGRAALFYYTCTKLMNNFNKVMKMKRKQCANLKKQSRNEQEQVWKKKTITITKMQTKNETLTQK